MQADHRSDRLPVVTEIPASVTVDRQSDLADLERLVSLSEKLAAAIGQPIPATITRATYSLMRDHLRALKASRTSRGRRRTGEAME